MPNDLKLSLISQMLRPNSPDAFLTLMTMSHPAWAETIRLVDNSSNIISRGQAFTAFPFKITLPPDDGETAREATVVIDNTSLDIIRKLREVTDEVAVKLEMIISSMPDEVQIAVEDLAIRNISYNTDTITARLAMDNFLQTEMTSEKYTPARFRGIF